MVYCKYISKVLFELITLYLCISMIWHICIYIKNNACKTANNTYCIVCLSCVCICLWVIWKKASINGLLDWYFEQLSLVLIPGHRHPKGRSFLLKW